MATVVGRWTDLVARMGDAPGDHQGNVTVVLVNGQQHKVASGNLAICAEMGNLIGLAAKLEDGRSVFWPAAAVVEVIDCATPEQPAAPPDYSSQPSW
jgi:hypothetical protein